MIEMFCPPLTPFTRST